MSWGYTEIVGRIFLNVIILVTWAHHRLIKPWWARVSRYPLCLTVLCCLHPYPIHLSTYLVLLPIMSKILNPWLKILRLNLLPIWKERKTPCSSLSWKETNQRNLLSLTLSWLVKILTRRLNVTWQVNIPIPKVCVTNPHTILWTIYHCVYKMILIIQASKCLVKPLETRLNPLLLQPKWLLHHVISVAHGWKGITSMCQCCSPEFMLWRIKLQGSPFKGINCKPLIRNSEQQVLFCLRMWSRL